MRPFSIASVFFIWIIAAGPAWALDAAGLVRDLADKAVTILSDSSASPADREERLGSLLKSSLDIPFVARFSAGRYWRQFSEAEQKSYLDAFEGYVLSLYSSRLNTYSGESIRVTDSRPIDARDTMVSSLLIRGNGSSVAVDWRVRTEDGNAQIIDVSVEGVSMALTQRQEFTSVLQREGIEGLVKRLRQPRDPGPVR